MWKAKREKRKRGAAEAETAEEEKTKTKTKNAPRQAPPKRRRRRRQQRRLPLWRGGDREFAVQREQLRRQKGLVGGAWLLLLAFFIRGERATAGGGWGGGGGGGGKKKRLCFFEKRKMMIEVEEAFLFFSPLFSPSFLSFVVVPQKPWQPTLSTPSASSARRSWSSITPRRRRGSRYERGEERLALQERESRGEARSMAEPSIECFVLR